MIINNASNFHYGNTNVKKVYQGNTLVWPTNTEPDVSLNYISTGPYYSGNYDVFYYPDYFISRKTRITAYFDLPAQVLPGRSFYLFGTYWQLENDARTQVNKYTLSINRSNNTYNAKFEWGMIYSDPTIPIPVTLTENAVSTDFRALTYLSGVNGPTVFMSTYHGGWNPWYTQSAVTDNTSFADYNKLLIFKDGDINTVNTCPGEVKLKRILIEEYVYDPFTPQGVNDRTTTVVHDYVPVLHYTTVPWSSVTTPSIVHPANQYYPCLYDTVTGQYCYNGGLDDPVYEVTQ